MRRKQAPRKTCKACKRRKAASKYWEYDGRDGVCDKCWEEYQEECARAAIG